MVREPTMIGTFKDCCPTLSDNNHHIRGFHLTSGLSYENLLYEDDNAQCKVCDCKHDVKRCPYIHPLNRRQEEPTKFVGPSCAWCHGKHLGIDCPNRIKHLELQAKREGSYAARTGIKFQHNPYRHGPSTPKDWLYSAWEYGYMYKDKYRYDV